ncbi:MAG TPA: hypothetical protein VE076_10680 [Nitrososphaeraceae archaeon]|nr:hypothetical protein [Nitrososphaeraceae archaeon]
MFHYGYALKLIVRMGSNPVTLFRDTATAKHHVIDVIIDGSRSRSSGSSKYKFLCAHNLS